MSTASWPPWSRCSIRSIVTNNGSPRALDVESLALRAEERFGPERVIAATTLPDAIETATALVEEIRP